MNECQTCYTIKLNNIYYPKYNNAVPYILYVPPPNSNINIQTVDKPFSLYKISRFEFCRFFFYLDTAQYNIMSVYKCTT